MAEEEKEEKKSGGGGNTLLIVMVILLFIMVMALGGLVVWLLLSQKGGGEGDNKAPAAHEAPAGHGEEGEHGNSHAKQYSPKYKQFEPPPEDAGPLYFEMKPFVVNFNGEGKAKFLAVTLKLMTYYPQLVGERGALEHLRPILRDRITLLLRKQTYSELSQPDGPEQLKKKILEVVRQTLEEHHIYPDLIEGVYFERFVMQ